MAGGIWWGGFGFCGDLAVMLKQTIFFQYKPHNITLKCKVILFLLYILK